MTDLLGVGNIRFEVYLVVSRDRVLSVAGRITERDRERWSRGEADRRAAGDH